MSSDRARDEAWEVQLTHCEANGTSTPDALDAETEVTLRMILGDASVDEIKRAEVA